MARTKDDLKSLSQIFRDEITFMIPDYQRGYSWEDEQREALWEDLENMTDNNSHYTGMFTFCQSTDDENVLSVVDGQQRLTTLIILINELLKKIEGGIINGDSVEGYKNKYLYHRRYGQNYYEYRLNYSDKDSDTFFRVKILEQHDSNEYLQSQTLYTQNLFNAKKFFYEKIKDYNQDELKELFKKVTERLKFNEYQIENLDELYVTFETMNNRGKKLSTLELLKNRLIYLTTLYTRTAKNDNYIQENAKNLRENINNTWKTIYQQLGKCSKKKLSDDAFLQDHWIMYFRYDRKKSMVFKDDLLSKIFTARQMLSGKLKIEEINNYINSLRDCVVKWFSINCPNEDSSLLDNEKIWLIRLNRVGIGSFRPLLMSAYYRKTQLDNENMDKLLEACERFRFLVFKVSGRRSNTSDYHFYGLANQFLKDASKRISDLVDDINANTNNWLNINNFINSIVDNYNKRNGFYSWSGLKYFLYEYERHLQSQRKDNDEKIDWEKFENNQKGKESIEHIYPQTPTDEYWLTRFKTQEDKNLTHSLGNLLLLSIAKNAEQQNASFDTKKTTIFKSGEIEHNGYQTGSYSEIKVSQETEWSPETIISRGKELIDFMCKHWNIQYTFTNDEINKLLNVCNKDIPNIIDNDAEMPDWDNIDDTTIDNI